MNGALFCPGQPCSRADTIKRLCGPIRSGGGLAVGAGLATGARRFMDTSQGRLTWTMCGQAASGTHARLPDRQRRVCPGPACAAAKQGGRSWERAAPHGARPTGVWADGGAERVPTRGGTEFMPVFANRDRRAPSPPPRWRRHTHSLSHSHSHTHTLMHVYICPHAHSHTQDSKCHPAHTHDTRSTCIILRSAFFLLKS